MAAGTAPEPPGSAPGTTAATLVERDSARRRLGDLVAAARDGRGGVVVLRGPAGVGKTALLDDVATRAGAGLLRLRARGLELERQFPWGGVRQLFEPLTAGGAAALSSAGAAARIVKPGEGPPEDAFAVVHALYWLTVELVSGRPALVVVDDLHWLDEPSLRFLAFLSARVAELPLAVALATRPSDDPLLRAALAQPHAEEITVAPLSAAGTAAFLRQRLGTAPGPAVGAAAHAATGGNPLLLGELVEALRSRALAPGDDHLAEVQALAGRQLSQVVRDRMVRLSSAAQACAEAVAVLGEATPATAAAVADLDEAAAAEAVDALVRVGVLGRTLPLSFVHPVLRTALLEHLPPARRAGLHVRAATLLRRLGAPPERCAAHWLQAPGVTDPEAVTVLCEAASRAVADGAPDVAVRYLVAALAAAGGRPHPGLLADLGVLEARLGLPGGVARLRQAVAVAADPVAAGRLARELAARLVLDTRWAEAVQALERGLADLGDADPDVRLMLEADLLGVRAYGQLSRPRAGALRALAGTSPGQRAALRAATFASAAGDGTADEAAAAAARGLRVEPGDAESEDPVSQWQGLYALVLAERFAEAERLGGRLEQAMRQRGLRPGLALQLYAKAHLALRTGRLHDALAWADEGRATAAEVALRGAEALCRGLAVEALVELGRLDEAADLLGPPVLSADDYARSFLLMASVRLLAARGDHRGVLAATGDHLAREHDGRARNPAVFPARSLRARALAATGEVTEARALVDDELDLAWRFGAAGPVAVAEREAGLLAEPPTGLLLLQASVQRLEASGRRLEHARSLLAFGGAVRRAGRREEARGPLRAALDLAERLGAAPLAASAREELAASGVRPGRRPHSGVAALTPSERRVALLAAEGRGNREIAQTLFVTLRTVETHLTHTYQKLGIASRAELPAVLGG